MTKKKTIKYAIVAIQAVVIVYAAVFQPYLKFQKTNVNPDETNLKEASCDITVTNPRGIPFVKNGDLIIEAISCQQQYVANCGRFGVFSDVGTLTLEGAGGLGSSTDLKISEGSSTSYNLIWCGSKTINIIKAKLFDGNGGLLQTKEVKVI